MTDCDPLVFVATIHRIHRNSVPSFIVTLSHNFIAHLRLHLDLICAAPAFYRSQMYSVYHTLSGVLEVNKYIQYL